MTELNNLNIIKYEEKIVFSLRDLYAKYGYRPYKMSKFEEYDFYLKNKDFLMCDNIITFNDMDGRLLALKPDVTLSIIKNSSDEVGCTHKVYYNENVYRVSPRTHTYKEIMQTGIECIGDIDMYNIAEVITLAANSLDVISDNFVLDISHMGIISSLLEDIDNETKKQILKCIGDKNPHDMRKICLSANIAQSKISELEQFIGIYGETSIVLEKLKDLGMDKKNPVAMQELRYICSMFQNTKYAKNIRFDFSIANDMNYYNGIVLKGFIENVPDGVLSGGQYDTLLHKMNRRSGAIGFAVYLDLLEQLDNASNDYDVDVLLLYSDDVAAKTVSDAVNTLTSQYNTVSAQKAVPNKLRCKHILSLDANGNISNTKEDLSNDQCSIT